MPQSTWKRLRYDCRASRTLCGRESHQRSRIETRSRGWSEWGARFPTNTVFGQYSILIRPKVGLKDLMAIERMLAMCRRGPTVGPPLNGGRGRAGWIDCTQDTAPPLPRCRSDLPWFAHSGTASPRPCIPVCGVAGRRWGRRVEEPRASCKSNRLGGCGAGHSTAGLLQLVPSQAAAPSSVRILDSPHRRAVTINVSCSPNVLDSAARVLLRLGQHGPVEGGGG